MNRVDRAMLIATVADNIPVESVDDLPMIRQAVNDAADAFRKSGYTCRDFAQDSIVRAIQQRIRHIHRQCQKTTIALKRLLGDDYETFLYADRD